MGPHLISRDFTITKNGGRSVDRPPPNEALSKSLERLAQSEAICARGVRIAREAA